MKETIQKQIDAIVGASATVEASLTPREYYVRTGAWFITAQQLHEIERTMPVQAISVDGHEIMLTIRL